MCVLIRVLEAAPPADVVNQNAAEVGLPGLDVPDQCLDPVTAIEAKTAFALVGIGPYDLQPFCSAYFRMASAWFSVEYR